MTGSGSLQGSSGDALDDATRHLRALAALLMRLFEALATLPADSQPISNGSRPTEVDVWAGLHDVMADLLRTSQEIQRLIDGLRPHAGEPATSQIGQNGDGDGDTPSAAGLAGDLARDALDVDLGTIIEEHQDDWAALVHAIRTQKFHGNNGARDENEPLELYSKVITTLPVELRRDFRRLTEWRTADEIAERHAAFELGRQIERQARQTRR